MPRCEYMDMVGDDVGDCGIQDGDGGCGAARQSIRLDSALKKTAMVVMEGKEFRGGLRPACRLDPEISRRDTRNAELLNQALVRPLIMATARLRDKSKKDNQGQETCRSTAGEAEAESGSGGDENQGWQRVLRPRSRVHSRRRA